MRRTLLLAAFVVVPLLAVVGVAIAGSSDDDPGSDADASGRATTTVAEVGLASTTPEGAAIIGVTEPADTPTDGGADGAGDGGETPATTVPVVTDVPSPPGVAGAEGERPVTTYPQPTVPEGGCPGGDGRVVITLSERPSPGCVAVAADQTIEFVNRTGAEISLVAEGLNEVVAPGTSFATVAGGAFPEGRSTFWSPGRPGLSGIIELRR